MKEIKYFELKELPFATKILVHIKMDAPEKRDETYKGVIVKDKVYYEDGKSDFIDLIAEYMYNGVTFVYILD